LAVAALAGFSTGLFAQTAATSGPKPVPVTTALSATTLSGYVDTSAEWNPGTGNANSPPFSFNGAKQDGFNVNSVDVKLASTLDSTPWAAAYTAELMYGPDAVTGTAAPIRQAFVTLHTPVGINFQVGQWDNLLGYEVNDSYKNPNYTRSYGYSIEPTEHVGILAAYQFSDAVGLQVGVANNLSANFNRNASGGTFGAGQYTIESKKAIVSLLTLTAPTNWGFIGGSTLNAGVDYGPGNAYSQGSAAAIPLSAHLVDKTHLYVGATLNTPITGLSLGASWDSVNNYDQVAYTPEGYASAVAAYVTYAVPSTKLTLNTRAEYAHGSGLNALFAETKLNGVAGTQTEQEAKVFAVTETAQYNLWGDSVISRVEARWDASVDGSPHFGATSAVTGGPTKKNSILLAANIIYKF
jgi:hypothetical protein